MKWEPGKTHLIADALSRAPVFAPPEDEEEDDHTMVRQADVEDPRILLLNETAQDDNDYRRIIEALSSTMPASRFPLEHPASQFAKLWDKLSLHKHRLLILDGNRIVVPQAARKKLLALGHQAHCEAQKMKALFKQLYYWPSMNNEIHQIVQSCEECRFHQPSHTAQPLQPIPASRPMERISVDLFESGGNKYLSVLDRYSGFPFPAKLTTTTTAMVIRELLKIFAQSGFPEIIGSDNGPQFMQESGEFCESHGIRHETSSPHFPQSNGHAECGVKVCNCFTNTTIIGTSSPLRCWNGKTHRGRMALVQRK